MSIVSSNVTFKPFFQVVRDAKVAGAQFPADFFNLQLNCNQNWIREKSEAKSPAIRTVFHHFFNKLQLKKIFLSTKIVKKFDY